MEYLENYGDDRQLAACVFCGKQTYNKDHVPSRVFLDKPYPNNPPHVPSCKECNESFSLDEEYLACLLECVCAGTVNEDGLERVKISKAIKRKPALKARLQEAQISTSKGIMFNFEDRRVVNIMLKLARGHAAFELNEPRREKPDHITFAPLVSLSKNTRKSFETPPEPMIWPEVGSRAMQRMLTKQDTVDGWIIVQPNRYRYLTHASDITLVRFVIREYLACEVVWNE